jgi:hypothetical protein
MTRIRRSILALACALGAAAAVASTAAAAPQATRALQKPQALQKPRALQKPQASVGGWRVAATIYPAKGSRVFLSSVVAPGASDVWTIGGTITNANQSAPVLRHWDGRTWKSVKMPASFKGFPFEPYQVAASSAADVWAFTTSRGASDAPSVGRWAHWNGRSWTTGTLPTVSVRGDASPAVTITAAAAAGPDDVWVGGTVWDWDSKFGLPAVAFLANYDGHAWRIYRVTETMPNLVGISALSPTNVWAAATDSQGTSGVGLSTSNDTVLMHWNGRAWQSVPTPKGVYVTDVAGVSADSAWVTGEVPGKGPGTLTSVAGAAHWNGTRWAMVPDAAADTQTEQSDYVYELTNVIADGNGGLWAIAEPYAPILSSLPGPASLWHYTNGRWTGVQLGSLGYLNLFQLAKAPGGESVWAVGTTVTAASPGYPQDGSILRYGNLPAR